MITTLRTAVVALAATFWNASRVVLAALMRSPRLRAVSRDAPFRWGRAILRAARVTVEVEGIENLPQGKPAIVVANHESWFDVFALVAHLPVDYRFVGKVELAKVPLFGRAWLAAGHIAIDRGNRPRAIESLRKAGEILHREGAVVVMFPEGTRTRDGHLLPFKKGAFILAAQSQVPLVPVGISGSRAVMPKGSWRVKSGKIRLRIGEPIPTEGLGEDARDRLLREARSAIGALRTPTLKTEHD
ncbi:MAG: 1-acyl-sn-glycerol-3-phosphate acyltransferase [Gemmatimonadales bacterium]|jgi:1-acyl-sn-glycerol-3-phosphate acyltransferase|nr:MAG: 1-acyl-sn-glycerol-3-phosphate acyltransferase [Gemmatimonadales bacterium]